MLPLTPRLPLFLPAPSPHTGAIMLHAGRERLFLVVKPGSLSWLWGLLPGMTGVDDGG